MSEETKRFDVIFECDAINPGRMRTDMKVRMLEPDPFECDLATDEMGFHGSTLDYHHRSNSYMNEVMDDREGLPITLSILFIELADRLDIPVSGLGLPGHFMAIFQEPKTKKTNSRELLIDSFGGKIITREEARKITGVDLKEEDFKPVSNRDIITRMLRNLIQSAEREQDSPARLRYIDAILAIDPDDRYTRAMRAMLHYGEGRYTDALIDIDF